MHLWCRAGSGIRKSLLGRPPSARSLSLGSEGSTMGAFPSSAELDAINGDPETHPRIRTTSRLNVDTLKVSQVPGHAACPC